MYCTVHLISSNFWSSWLLHQFNMGHDEIVGHETSYISWNVRQPHEWFPWTYPTPRVASTCAGLLHALGLNSILNSMKFQASINLACMRRGPITEPSWSFEVGAFFRFRQSVTKIGRPIPSWSAIQIAWTTATSSVCIQKTELKKKQAKKENENTLIRLVGISVLNTAKALPRCRMFTQANMATLTYVSLRPEKFWRFLSFHVFQRTYSSHPLVCLRASFVVPRKAHPTNPVWRRNSGHVFGSQCRYNTAPGSRWPWCKGSPYKGGLPSQERLSTSGR